MYIHLFKWSYIYFYVSIFSWFDLSMKYFYFSLQNQSAVSSSDIPSSNTLSLYLSLKNHLTDKIEFVSLQWLELTNHYLPALFSSPLHMKLFLLLIINVLLYFWCIGELGAFTLVTCSLNHMFIVYCHSLIAERVNTTITFTALKKMH